MNNATANTSQMNHLRVISWCGTYSILAIATVTGNALTIAVLLQKKLPHMFGGYFMLNLALADFMVGALALPMYIYIVYTYTYHPLNGSLPVFQHIYTAIDVFTGLASVFTLASIALDRLYAIIFPLDYRWTTKKTYSVIISLVWVASGTASIAYILSVPTVVSLLPERAFTFYLTSVSILSLFVICAAYTAIWIRIRLWNRVKHEREFSVSRQEKRLATALFIVTVVFVLTWSPFHILNILVNFKKSVLFSIPVDLVFLGKLLHYINSLANPAIYSLKIPEFRRAIRLMFCKNWVPETRV